MSDAPSNVISVLTVRWSLCWVFMVSIG